jgi:hypothetical protein
MSYSTVACSLEHAAFGWFWLCISSHIWGERLFHCVEKMPSDIVSSGSSKPGFLWHFDKTVVSKNSTHLTFGSLVPREEIQRIQVKGASTAPTVTSHSKNTKVLTCSSISYLLSGTEIPPAELTLSLWYWFQGRNSIWFPPIWEEGRNVLVPSPPKHVTGLMHVDSNCTS